MDRCLSIRLSEPNTYQEQIRQPLLEDVQLS
jgi:hypothetical protein